MKKQVSIGVLAAAIVLTAAAVFNVAYLLVWNNFSDRLANFTAREADYGKINEIRAYLDACYIDEYDSKDLMEGAARGMLDELPDGWSYYMSAGEYEQNENGRDASMVGIGVNAYYDEETSQLRVVEVYRDSPAEKSGVRFYDVILAIDDTAIAGLGQENIDNALRGEAGSTVSLTVEHSDGSIETLTVERAQISEQALESALLDDQVGYIRIPAFEERVDVQFEGVIEILREQGAESLIIDLRFNPGGREEIMCRMLDLLLPEGVIMQRVNKLEETTVVNSDAACVDMPIAVVINGYSFGVSEFFAATLQEYGAAVIVGDQTAGKCYAQSVYELSDGSAIALSTSEYVTPQGRTLQDTGVVPDVSISLPQEQLYGFASLSHADDAQLHAALEALAG